LPWFCDAYPILCPLSQIYNQHKKKSCFAALLSFLTDWLGPSRFGILDAASSRRVSSRSHWWSQLSRAIRENSFVFIGT
jgi:hypothetical protein